jgi:hypothetical protein
MLNNKFKYWEGQILCIRLNYRTGLDTSAPYIRRRAQQNVITHVNCRITVNHRILERKSHWQGLPDSVSG